MIKQTNGIIHFGGRAEQFGKISSLDRTLNSPFFEERTPCQFRMRFSTTDYSTATLSGTNCPTIRPGQKCCSSALRRAVRSRLHLVAAGMAIDCLSPPLFCACLNEPKQHRCESVNSCEMGRELVKTIGNAQLSSEAEPIINIVVKK